VREQGKHVFEIFDYSKHRGMGKGEFIRSGTFSVGGFDWAIRFYPDGSSTTSTDYISVYLELMKGGAKVRASCDLSLINRSTGLPSLVHRTELRMFNYNDVSRYAPQTSSFQKRSELEASGCLQDDRLVIECVVTVVKKRRCLKPNS
jgi:speckle-type POZ protein